MPSQADEIRQHTLEYYVQPWRESGESALSIRAGDVARTMGLRDRTPGICSALESHVFQREAGLVLIDSTGPRRSTTTTFHYQPSDGSTGSRMKRETGRSARSYDPDPHAPEEISVDGTPVDGEEPEGLDPSGGSWGDYPIDHILIRNENRTIHDVIRRIDKGAYVMNPDFQRDFVWPEDKQSKLIESVIMRIPLPVFYMAEDDEGRMVVVDGLQRLSTFKRFMADDLKLKLSDREELDGKKFSDLKPKLQNRVEDCNLIFYIIDSRVPERARLDIFERVNGGVPLTRQQMRNCLFMGPATQFLKEEALTEIFLKATGRSLNQKTMRDREFVNRFCAFQILDIDEYRGDMDDFLAGCLRRMNRMEGSELSRLSAAFHRSLSNNFKLFEEHAFRRHRLGKERRSVLNASLWDVMSTGLSRYAEDRILARSAPLRDAIYALFEDEKFDDAITRGPNDAGKVKARFRMTRETLEEVLGAHAD